MQKNAPDHYPRELIDRYEVPKEEGGTTVYPVVHSEEAVAFFANFGVITFHVPSVRIEDEYLPDWAIWDLDPPPDRVDLVRQAAYAMRAILDGFGIPTMPLTSGSKGYHLRARLAPKVGIDDVSAVARGTAALAAEQHPDLMTLAFRKADRGERVFVDWLRNTPRSTSVAPWSLRARPGAPLAAPLTWEELDTIEPDGIRLATVQERLSMEPWSDQKPIDLSSAVEPIESAVDEAGIVLESFDRFRS
jgi:bifunctional non-homologous end joining protein LigD